LNRSAKAAVAALVVIGVVMVALAVHTNSPPLRVRTEPGLAGGPADAFDITLRLRDGPELHAAVVCEGDIVGTGYLERSPAGFNACSAPTDTFPLVDYLLKPNPRSLCGQLIAAAAKSNRPTAPRGEASIVGGFFGRSVNRNLESISNDPCHRAVWKLLTPLLAPTDESGAIVQPWPPEE
jgi:hypothetical protein